MSFHQPGATAMKSPARNKKSTLRALRIPNEIDQEICHASAAGAISYSACLVELIRMGLKNAHAATPYGVSERERVAESMLAKIKGASQARRRV
ncbi:hypothetical protein [Citrobacter freundii]|uniref:hypothetical protein n=2 Tax=Citrobacter freundii TaxID=546 RepID=UPI0040431738